MKKRENVAFAIIVVFLLSVSSLNTHNQPQSITKGERVHVEESEDVISLLPDPHVAQSPTVIVNETSEYLNLLFKTTWGGMVNETFPNTDVETDDFCHDIETGENGAVYVIGSTRTPRGSIFESGNFFEFEIVLKYDSSLNLMWKRRNYNNTRGYAVAEHNGYVYTAGSIYSEGALFISDTFHDAHITKWGPGGNRLWSKKWGDMFEQYAIAVDVSEDSSVYVLVSDQNWRLIHLPDYYRSAVLKYNSAGRLLWNKTLDIWTFPEFGADIFVAESALVIDYSNFLSVLDLDGNELWNMTYTGDAVVDSNHVYVTRAQGSGIQIEKWNLDGANIWNSSFEQRTANGDLDNIYGIQLNMGSDESVFLHTGGYVSGFHYFTKWNSDGTFNWTSLVGTTEWPEPYHRMPVTSVSSWGISYFAMSLPDLDFHVYAYQIGEYSLPIPSAGLSLMFILGGAFGAVALVVITWVYRKRRL
jgi:hypothetical protein